VLTVYCTFGLYWLFKNSKFRKSHTVMATILKNVKPASICPISSKFGMMMHIGCPNDTGYNHVWKFENPRRQTITVLKMENCNISTTIWLTLVKFCTTMHCAKNCLHYFLWHLKYTVSPKNDTNVACYNLNPHHLILVIFGRDVAVRCCCILSNGDLLSHFS